MCLSILSEWVEVLPMGWKIKIRNTLKKNCNDAPSSITYNGIWNRVKLSVTSQKIELNDNQSPELISQDKNVKQQSSQLLNKANKPGSSRLSAKLCHLNMWSWNKQYLRKSICFPFSLPRGYHPSNQSWFLHYSLWRDYISYWSPKWSPSFAISREPISSTSWDATTGPSVAGGATARLWSTARAKPAEPAHCLVALRIKPIRLWKHHLLPKSLTSNAQLAFQYLKCNTAIKIVR